MTSFDSDMPFENATPIGRPSGGLWFNDRTELVQARTLAGWITLLAEDRELDDRQLAVATGLDLEDVRAVREGAVAMLPPRLLNRALARLEGRNDEGRLQ
ncbi:hypothetical protein JHL17_18600 [Azospirillum sp. YIM B02556]|uniref:Uncharacterized protein n=1 Tax=Azospirillum endophyticum TaxID=2800326 RepID=A0ABS1F7L4_9PROT|nr:hypothetical protein [Azospirillum endophyticum]MBK1839423.1 hypothetical protein [Azospirillum endophyticum]